LSEVLIISTCRYRLSEEEFVRPLREIAENLGYRVEVKSYREKTSIKRFKVIISGTALRDFDYLNYTQNFKWINEFDRKIFGICAGAQIISLALGCPLVNNKLIGIYDVEILGEKCKAYFLTSMTPRLDGRFEVLGRIDDTPAYFKVRGRAIYGSLFYPEVLNKELLISFLKDR